MPGKRPGGSVVLKANVPLGVGCAPPGVAAPCLLPPSGSTGLPPPCPSLGPSSGLIPGAPLSWAQTLSASPFLSTSTWGRVEWPPCGRQCWLQRHGVGTACFAAQRSCGTTSPRGPGPALGLTGGPAKLPGVGLRAGVEIQGRPHPRASRPSSGVGAGVPGQRGLDGTVWASGKLSC